MYIGWIKTVPCSGCKRPTPLATQNVLRVVGPNNARTVGRLVDRAWTLKSASIGRMRIAVSHC